MNRPYALFLFFAAALPLAACHSGPPKSPVQAMCERQADNDPRVQDVISRGGDYVVDHRGLLNRYRHDAVNRCLQANGVPIPPGGVQAPDDAGGLPSLF